MEPANNSKSRLHSSDIEVPCGDVDESSGVEPTDTEKKPLSLGEVPLEVQEQSDFILAKRFVSGGAEGLARKLSSSFSPYLSAGWEEILRTKVSTQLVQMKEKGLVLLKELSSIQDQMRNALRLDPEERTIKLAVLVRSELSSCLDDASSFIEESKDFNNEVYDHALALNVGILKKYLRDTRQLAGTTDESIEKRAMDELKTSRVQYTDLIPMAVSDELSVFQIGALGKNVDLNSVVSRVVNNTSFDISYEKKCPVTLAHEAYVHMILSTVSHEFERCSRKIKTFAQNELSKNNSIYQALNSNQFKNEREGRIALELLLDDDVMKARIGNGGEVTFRLSIPEVLREFADVQKEVLAKRLKPLREALELSGSTMKIEYSPSWGEFVVQVVFRVQMDEGSLSYSESMKRSALYRERRERHLERSVNSRQLSLERKAQIGKQERDYKVTFNRKLLEKSTLRKELLRILERTDKYMLCLKRFDRAHVDYDFSKNLEPSSDEMSDSLRVYLLGKSDSQDHVEVTKKKKDLSHFLEKRFDWQDNHISSWSDKNSSQEIQDEEEIDRGLQFTFDSTTIFDEELGDLIADLESKADIIFCGLLDDLYKDLTDNNEKTDTQRLMVSVLEGVSGLLDTLSHKYPAERFRVLMPALVKKAVSHDSNGSIRSIDKVTMTIVVSTGDDAPLASGYFDPEKENILYVKRNAQEEKELIDAVIECIGEVDSSDVLRGSRLVHKLQERDVFLPLVVVQNFMHEEEMEQFFESGDNEVVESSCFSPKEIEKELKTLFNLPLTQVVKDGSGAIVMKKRSLEEFILAPRREP